MRGKIEMGWFLLLALVFVGYVHGGDVTYDGRSLIINGNRSILFSGSIHYPRSTPQMWPSLIGKAKQGGLDVIDTYVFWNVHEPQLGQYNFEGRYDLVAFLKEVHAQGLYVILRIGPFIESEWRYGGLPFWLHDVQDVIFRTDNDQYKFYMQNFTTKIVNMMKAENLYASQGGPIILSQIENEYKNVEPAYHKGGPRYVKWAAEMAVGLNTGVPWVMCKQDDAPDPVINSCNGLNCGETFQGPNSPNKPAIWTENWTQQYEVFGEKPRKRSPEDIAFAVALFVAKKKGCFVNYYMYHGGTNFGRWGSAYVKTSYYDDAPLDEYGLISQPKWGHLKDLHTAIKSCSATLLAGNLTEVSLGEEQAAYVYEDNSGNCVAFLSNTDLKSSSTVNFRSMSYELPRRSISILLDCKNVGFNTAKVNAPYNSRSTSLSQKFGAESWEKYKEVIPSFDETSIKATELLDQMNTTKDDTDYLWYTFSYMNGQTDQLLLHVESTAHVLHVFVNGAYSGSAQGKHGDKSFVFEKSIPLNNGMNNISLLSVMFGLLDSGAYMERKGAGIFSIEIRGKAQSSWGYQVGLVGENLSLSEGSPNVSWTSLDSQVTLQRLVWYKANFSAPAGDDSLALDLSSMGKGEAWVNGNSIGRYWVSLLDPQGNPSQTLYHVPRDFLQPTGNQLVLFEEMGGDPTQISLNTISTNRACGRLSYSHLPTKVLQKQMVQRMKISPRMQFKCPSGKKISSIEFASFGNPSGDCGNYAVGSCHSENSREVVEKACIGKERCSMSLSTRKFGGDPCPGTTKSLLVDATCA